MKASLLLVALLWCHLFGDTEELLSQLFRTQAQQQPIIINQTYSQQGLEIYNSIANEFWHTTYPEERQITLCEVHEKGMRSQLILKVNSRELTTITLTPQRDRSALISSHLTQLLHQYTPGQNRDMRSTGL